MDLVVEREPKVIFSCTGDEWSGTGKGRREILRKKPATKGRKRFSICHSNDLHIRCCAHNHTCLYNIPIMTRREKGD